MARRTRRCCPVSQARCVSRKRSPCWRTMSATSKGGRYGTVEIDVRRRSIGFDYQRSIQKARDSKLMEALRRGPNSELAKRSAAAMTAESAEGLPLSDRRLRGQDLAVRR